MTFLGQTIFCVSRRRQPWLHARELRPRAAPAGVGYYARTLGLTSVAAIGQLPQVSMPVAQVGTVPVGLSLLARHGQDALLLEVAENLASETGFGLNDS